MAEALKLPSFASNTTCYYNRSWQDKHSEPVEECGFFGAVILRQAQDGCPEMKVGLETLQFRQVWL